MPVRISIITDDDIEELSAVEIKKEFCKEFDVRDAQVKVSKLTTRQYKKLIGES